LQHGSPQWQRYELNLSAECNYVAGGARQLAGVRREAATDLRIISYDSIRFETEKAKKSGAEKWSTGIYPWDCHAIRGHFPFGSGFRPGGVQSVFHP
jgi:hypothetical protein